MRTLIALLFLLAAAQAQQISGGSGGGPSSITSGVTTCTSCPANSIATSNGTIVTFTTTPIAASLALGGATIGSDVLAVSGSVFVVNGTGGFRITQQTTGTVFGSYASGSPGGFAGVYFGGTSSSTASVQVGTTSGDMINGRSVGVIGWSSISNNPDVSNRDTSLSRNAAGVVQFGTTAANAAGSWLAASGTLDAANSTLTFKASGTQTGRLSSNIGIAFTGNAGGITAEIANWGGGHLAVRLGNAGFFEWDAGASPGSTGVDTTLFRSSGGVVGFGTTGNTANGSWLATNGTLSGTLDTTGTARLSHGFTVATLPAAGTAGRRAYVTDQNAACVATGAALTGGGAVVCPVFDNGSAWVGG